MEVDNLYQSIYEYLLARIYFGLYPRDNRLPSIHMLGDLFGVSTITVRSAYRLLEKDGYIVTHKNKRPEILPDPPDQPREFPGRLLLNEAVQWDLYRSCGLILPRIYYCGLNACSDRELQNLHLILENPVHTLGGPAVDFLACIVKELKNSLALNLYYDLVLFSTPTYLAALSGEARDWKQFYANLSAHFTRRPPVSSTGDKEALWQQIQGSCALFLPRPAPASQEFLRDTPYRWHRPRVCLSTVIRLLRGIILGTYPAGSFLPSARALAEETSTAVITVRRAIVLLNDMGLAESINGRGTRILPAERYRDRLRPDKPSVRKILMTYLEALHLLAITCRGVAEAVFPQLTPESKAGAAESIRLAQRRGRAGMSIYIYLNILTASTELDALREIYSQLSDLLILGLPLSCLGPALRLERCTPQLTAVLESPDPQLFADMLELMLEYIFLSSREKLVRIGIQEAGRMVLEPGKC